MSVVNQIIAPITGLQIRANNIYNPIIRSGDTGHQYVQINSQYPDLLGNIKTLI